METQHDRCLLSYTFLFNIVSKKGAGLSLLAVWNAYSSHSRWLRLKIMMWKGWYFHWGSWWRCVRRERFKISLSLTVNISHFHNFSIPGAHTQGSSYLVPEYLPCWTTNKTSRTVILSSCVLMFLLSIPMPPKEPYCKPPGQRKSYESKTHVPKIFSNAKTTSTQRASFRFLRCFLLCQPKTSIKKNWRFLPPKKRQPPTPNLLISDAPPDSTNSVAYRISKPWKLWGFYWNSNPNKEWRVGFHAVCFTQKTVSVSVLVGVSFVLLYKFEETFVTRKSII